MPYDEYKHLVGRMYISGYQDCYGLARCYYKDVFQMELTNFARPTEWWLEPGLNLLTDNLFLDGWEDVGTNLRNLRVGDGLLFTLISGRANHVGVYVGNGHFIHHIFGRLSAEEPLVHKWMSRCLMVVRHKTVTKLLAERGKSIELKELRANVPR